MSLLTRCLHCKTLFRVTAAQLAQRDGTVRCGRCMTVFDAYAALGLDKTPALTGPVHATVNAATATAPPSAEVEPAAPLVTPAPVPDARAERSDAIRVQNKPADVVAPKLPDVAPVPVQPAQPSSWRRMAATPHVWVAAAVGLTLLLALQLAYAYRSELAAHYPLVRPAYTWVCGHVGCRVPLPQHADRVRIEASDVQVIDAARPQVIKLTATLRSYASYDVAYPALDLVLTNTAEHAIARRIFAPDEYLRAPRDTQAGIAANAEITVALELDMGNLDAAGFRLSLLSAPVR